MAMTGRKMPISRRAGRSWSLPAAIAANGTFDVAWINVHRNRDA
jgi:hypothetical protein